MSRCGRSAPGARPPPPRSRRCTASIRDHARALFGPAGSLTPILYGGSVKAANAAAILATDHVDGALVGGASLNASDFLAIIQAA